MIFTRGFEILADSRQRMLELHEPAEREVLALHGHDHAVGRRERVDGDQPERRRRVDEDLVVVALHRQERLLERALAADHRGQRELRAGQLDRRDGDVDLGVLDDLLDRHALHEHVEHRLLELLGIEALRHRQVGLRVQVDDEDAAAPLGEGDGEVDRAGRLRDPALLVRKRQSLAPRRFPVSLPPGTTAHGHRRARSFRALHSQRSVRPGGGILLPAGSRTCDALVRRRVARRRATARGGAAATRRDWSRRGARERARTARRRPTSATP